MESKLITLWAPIRDDSESIESWWNRNKDYIQSITTVDTEEEVIIWTASYYRYGMYLHGEGYSTNSLEYINKAFDILDRNKGKMYEHNYQESLETMLYGKCNVLYSLEKYWEAYKIMSELHRMKPLKDDFRLAKKNLLTASINKVVIPCYIILACVWILMLIEKFVLHTEYIPSFVWDVTWLCWVALLIIQFVVPVVLYKIQK